MAVTALADEGHEGQPYFVTGPEVLAMDAMTGRLSSVSGREVKYADVSPDADREALLGRGTPAWFVERGLIRFDDHPR